MKINYQVGDLFANLPTDRKVVVPHVANSNGIMGSGFVVPLLRHFPGVDRVYKKICRTTYPLGITDFFVKDNVTIANMIAQDGYGGHRPLRYVSLIDCMWTVRNHIEDSGGNIEIIAPKFGSLRAGGTWEFIEQLIEEIWLSNNIPVTIYTYEEKV